VVLLCRYDFIVQLLLKFFVPPFPHVGMMIGAAATRRTVTVRSRSRNGRDVCELRLRFRPDEE
jgi:hypothetical protein